MYPHFKIYYKATIAKIIWYCLKNKHTDQGNRKENPKMSLHLHGQLIDGEEVNSIQWGNVSLLNK